LRIHDRISLITRIQNAQSLFFFVLVIGLTYFAGVYGTFSAQLLSTLFVLVVMRTSSPYRFHIRLNGGLLWRVLVYSIPVFFLYGILDTTIDNLNIFMLAHHLGTSQVGLYSIGLSLSAVLFLWPKSLSTVFSTRIITEVNRDQVEGGVAGTEMFLRLLMANCLVFVVFVSITYVFMPVIIRVVFPAYLEATPAARLLTLAMYYQAIGGFAVFVLMGQKRFNSYLFVLGVFLAVLFPVLWWVAPKGIVYVAGVVVLYRLVNSQVILSMAVRHAFRRRLEFAAYCGRLYLLGLLPVLLGWLVDLSALPVTRSNFFPFAPHLAAIFSTLTLGFAVVLYWLNRQTGLLRELSQT
jgi:O-antigen/teichoic acid export membrane protein